MKKNKTHDVTQRFVKAVETLINTDVVKNKSAMAKELDISPSKFTEIMKGRMRPGLELFKIISEKYNINPEWLLTGRGEMLKKGDEGEKMLQPAQPGEKGAIPLVRVTANAGHGNFDALILEKDVSALYKIPKFSHLNPDFLIEISGNSMSPKYYSGDLIAVKRLDNPEYIQWGRPHLIGTKDQGIMVKRIYPSNKTGYYLLKSDNPEYPPFEIPVDEINGIGLVVGVVRLE